MMSIPLFKRNLIIGMKLMIPFIAILTMYNSIIIWMYDPELSKSLDQFQEIMPQMMAAVGMTGATGTMIEFINTYLYGFIMLFVPLIFIILLVNRLIMKYVDDGSIACLLATPNSRKKIIVTQMVSVAVLITLLLVIMAGIGLGCSEVMFPGKLHIGKYILLNVSTLLLDFAISGICILAACIFNENKWYMAIGAGLPLLFYVIQMMANMGEDLKKLEYFTLFTLMPGRKIVEGESGILLPLAVLFVIGVLLYIVGQVCFRKKDLSV